MIPRLINFAKRPTSVNVIINTFGNYLNVFFTALFALILVRILTPPQYGVLSVLLGIAYVLANILDFGTTATIYSYLPNLYEKKTYELYRFIKSTFYYQSIFSFFVIAVLLISFPFLDKVFFKTDAPWSELALTSISVLFLIWQNFLQNILFAAKKFVKTNVYLNIANIIKTLIVFLMIYLKIITVGSVIFVFGILGPVIFFFLLFLEKKDLVSIFLKSEVKRSEFRFGYTLTYFLASQFFNLGLRMDLFLLSYFRSKTEVGYYGLSQKIILTIITTIVSITQVLSPSFSKITRKSEALSQLKTGFMYLLLPSALFFILFFTPKEVYDLFFTDKFVQTAPITRALSLPFVLYALGSLPVLFLLYTVKKPVYILISNVVFFIILTLGCYFLIPKMGVFGPPYAIALALIVATGIQIVASIKEFKKMFSPRSQTS
ncbi:oligosaccharide flippase family protein [Candidatus Roizmanbacteria bacterium]|nr:oligosaccharide flippase family protein [Candidatus Roizmanbacteria bacterium]